MEQRGRLDMERPRGDAHSQQDIGNEGEESERLQDRMGCGWPLASVLRLTEPPRGVPEGLPDGNRLHIG